MILVVRQYYKNEFNEPLNRKEGNILFNDALNTFYLRLYGKGSQIMREETRCHHIGYSFRLATGFFYMHHPTDRIIHTTYFVTPVVEH